MSVCASATPTGSSILQAVQNLHDFRGSSLKLKLFTLSESTTNPLVRNFLPLLPREQKLRRKD